jgi:hypothetical protein
MKHNNVKASATKGVSRSDFLCVCCSTQCRWLEHSAALSQVIDDYCVDSVSLYNTTEFLSVCLATVEKLPMRIFHVTSHYILAAQIRQQQRSWDGR